MAHLIVEDGTGLPNATGYVSVSFVNVYHQERCNSGWSAADDVKQAAIIKASEYIDRTYDFQGDRKNTGEPSSSTPLQALAWPRDDVVHADGFLVDPDAVPVEVQRATAELALVLLTDALDPAVRGGRVSSSTEAVGRVSRTRTFGSPGLASNRTEVPVATAILRPLLGRGASGGYANLVRT